jgi:hypothetical protein
MNTFLNKKWLVRVKIPLFGSTGTLKYLEFLAFKPGVEITVKTPKKNYIRGDKREFAFEFDHEYQSDTFTKTLVKTFNSNFLEFSTECKPVFDNDWEHLREMCKSHDLHHEMSDDHRVWQNGQFELEQIKKLAQKLTAVDKVRVQQMVSGIYTLK